MFDESVWTIHNVDFSQMLLRNTSALYQPAKCLINMRETDRNTQKIQGGKPSSSHWRIFSPFSPLSQYYRGGAWFRSETPYTRRVCRNYPRLGLNASQIRWLAQKDFGGLMWSGGAPWRRLQSSGALGDLSPQKLSHDALGYSQILSPTLSEKIGSEYKWPNDL